MSNRAVCYLRSSKDKSDISIDTQRRALHEFAVSRGLVVVDEYADAVESGKDEDRPAWLRLLREMRVPGRPWEYVIALDTSRIARRRLIALQFERDCERHQVRIAYKNLPESDPATEMIIRSVFQAFDEYHSLVSRAKGLAGMRENVRQGWRAGGRAPRGYQLEYTATGAIRDGIAVQKSKLIPDDESELVAAYLRARAGGEMRGQIMARLGIDWPVASLNGMEWQALTYAGHTVWNMHQARDAGQSKSGERRRPRAEWVIQRDTHTPLIGDDEAETILQALETQRATHRRQDAVPYLLTGLLQTPDGRAWAGDAGGYYRLAKGKRISAKRVDEAVMGMVFEGLASGETAEKVAQAMRAAISEPVDGRVVSGLERRLVTLAGQITKTVDLAGRMENPDPVLRRVSELEGERAGVVEKLAQLRRRQAQAEAVEEIGADEVQALLGGLQQELQESGDIIEMRRILSDLLERIELDPDTFAGVLHYRLGGVTLASRRGAELSPVRWPSPLAVGGRRRRA